MDCGKKQFQLTSLQGFFLTVPSLNYNLEPFLYLKADIVLRYQYTIIDALLF